MMAPDSQSVKLVLGSMIASFCEFMVIILRRNDVYVPGALPLGLMLMKGGFFTSSNRTSLITYGISSSSRSMITCIRFSEHALVY